MLRACIVVLLLTSVAHAKDADPLTELSSAIKQMLKSQNFEKSSTKDAMYSVLAYEHDDVAIPVGRFEFQLVDLARDLKMGLLRDKKSAWATFVTHVGTFDGASAMIEQDARVSCLFVKQGASWLAASCIWSVGVADAEANADAKAGKLDMGTVDASSGDPGLIEAYDNIVAKGFDATVAASKELVGIGTAPKDRTVGGKGLVPFFNKNWAGKLENRGGRVGILAPGDTSGVVIGNVNLVKRKGASAYKIPMRIFIVFDKSSAGAWTPVHVHFAVKESE